MSTPLHSRRSVFFGLHHSLKKGFHSHNASEIEHPVDDISKYAELDEGYFLRSMGHRILVKRGQTRMSMQSLQDGNTTKDRIGKRTLLLQQTYEQMTNMNETTYGVPASRTFPAIDAVCLPYFFQMTVQPSRSIMLKPFATFVHDMIRLKKLEKDADIKFVFVVPPYVFDDYKRCVRELTTHWQSPCLIVLCSEQKYILDGNEQYNSTNGEGCAFDQAREARGDREDEGDEEARHRDSEAG
jgi:hypothetical protein